MGKERLVWADAFRGLLILLVVLGHSLQFGDYENRLSWNIINSFHVATFFLISGFVSYKMNYNISLIKKRFQQLMIPFLTWILLRFLICPGGENALINAFLYPDTAYWFIWTLFGIASLFIVIQNFPFKQSQYQDEAVCGVNHRKPVCCSDFCLLLSIVVLILIMVITEFRMFGFQFFAFYFGFYVYGYWLRKYSISFNTIWIIVLGIIWGILALFWKKHDIPTPLANINIPGSIIIYSYRYITAFVGGVVGVGSAMIFMNKENIVTKCLRYIGKISLGIYIIHLFIGRYVSNIVYDIFNSYTSLPFVMSDFITKLIISIILINIIQRIPIVRLLLLGKK